jgi:hypothetical protein
MFVPSTVIEAPIIASFFVSRTNPFIFNDFLRENLESKGTKKIINVKKRTATSHDIIK